MSLIDMGEMMETKHALKRSQQRGIPPLIKIWLLEYGEERVFKEKKCIKELKKYGENEKKYVAFQLQIFPKSWNPPTQKSCIEIKFPSIFNFKRYSLLRINTF